MRFDENLRNLRKEKDYSQEYLAEKLGVTRQTISKWENGSAMPDLKKLIELADFFETSMDDLLGLDYETMNPKQNFAESAGNDYNEAEAILANRYTNDLINTVSNRMNSKTKGISILLAFVAIGLAISVIFISGTISALQSQISGLNNSISYLQQNNPGSNYYDNDDYYDVAVNLLKVYPEAPHIAQVEFKYAPTSYPKNSKIYYLIPKKDGGVDRLEAADNNGEFVLTADIDLSVNSPCYFVLDDGENIIKQEVYLFVDDVYGSCSDDIYYEIDENRNSNAYHFSSEFDNISWWNKSKQIKINSAEIVLKNNGTEAFRQALKKNNEDSDHTMFSLVNFDVEDITLKSPDVYIEIKFDNGVIAKRHFESSWTEDYSATENQQEEMVSMNLPEYYNEYIFTIDEKTVIVKSF